MTETRKDLEMATIERDSAARLAAEMLLDHEDALSKGSSDAGADALTRALGYAHEYRKWTQHVHQLTDQLTDQLID
jgi:hypothetical protein